MFRRQRQQHARSRKRGVAPIPADAQVMLLEEFDGQCAYCLAPATTWDHIVPVVTGGETVPWNIVPACLSCNSSKNCREVFEWMTKKGLTGHDRLFERMVLEYVL
jgi:5-methylcytosine-specific restriction endonuclease McrA